MGQKRAAYDEAGNLTGLFDDALSPAPQGVATIPLNADQWQACLANWGGYVVKNGALVNAPTATAAELLAAAQDAKLAELTAAYQGEIYRDVSYMGTTFQADDYSQTLVTKCVAPGAVPNGFFWNDAANNPVPMTFQELQGLAGAMLAQGQAAFAKLQGYKSAVRSATDVAAVQAIAWA
jgi:hypothetical protein